MSRVLVPVQAVLQPMQLAANAPRKQRLMAQALGFLHPHADSHETSGSFLRPDSAPAVAGMAEG